ncbi:MAG: hypothetical protein QM601_01870 [Pseudoxanthomonas sp.]
MRIENALTGLDLPLQRRRLRRDAQAGHAVVDVRMAAGRTHERLLDAAEALGRLQGIAAVELAGKPRAPR